MNGGTSILKCFMQRNYSLKKTIDANVRVITHTYMLFAYVITFVYSSHTYMLFVQDIITHMYTSAQVTFHINSLHINVTCSFNSVMSSLYTKLCTCTLFCVKPWNVCISPLRVNIIASAVYMSISASTFCMSHYRVGCVHFCLSSASHFCIKCVCVFFLLQLYSCHVLTSLSKFYKMVSPNIFLKFWAIIVIFRSVCNKMRSLIFNTF